MFFLIFFSCYIYLDQVSANILSVKGDRVNSRSEPSQQATVLFEYDNGFPVEVVKQQGSWILTKDFEGDSGWIHKSRLRKGKQVIVKANQSQEKKINIRNGPGVDSAVVATAYYGVVFTVLERRGNWVNIRHDSGLKGWVNAELLWGI